MEKFTAIYEHAEDGWWVVSMPEIPGAISRGRTLEEVLWMIKDAVKLLSDVRREKDKSEIFGRDDMVREVPDL